MANHQTRTVFGPFHRIEAPEVQDAATLIKQLTSGEIWGHPAKWGGSPAVKAHAGRLPDGESGVEFWSFQAPDTPAGPRVYWRSSGPFVTVDEVSELAKLQAAFIRFTQDLLP